MARDHGSCPTPDWSRVSSGRGDEHHTHDPPTHEVVGAERYPIIQALYVRGPEPPSGGRGAGAGAQFGEQAVEIAAFDHGRELRALRDRSRQSSASGGPLRGTTLERTRASSLPAGALLRI